MKNKTDAFTLIELLISAFILSLFFIIFYSAFNISIITTRRIESTLKLYRLVSGIFGRINLDLRNTFYYALDDAKFYGDKKKMQFYSLVAGDLAQVTYEFRDKKLLRVLKYNLEAFRENPQISLRTIDGSIEDINFKYLSSIGEEGDYKWQDYWGKEKNNLPLAVRIEVILTQRFSPRKNADVRFSKVIFLPLAKE
ncbi:MAG: prepilin-type N-terminal cleavage/methylation domain-containing protein [Candidatus Omnitrophica bacterium]|nr:prepilin-type N-terminal cleavage/methylation domain-containing protein [Candidatus Omnitrophota bacterium]